MVYIGQFQIQTHQLLAMLGETLRYRDTRLLPVLVESIMHDTSLSDDSIREYIDVTMTEKTTFFPLNTSLQVYRTHEVEGIG